MFAFKTLQRRLIALLVVPVTLFLLGFGIFGYRFIHGILFKEWQETAILRLERAAHQMDMKLHEQMGGWRPLPGPEKTPKEQKFSAGFCNRSNPRLASPTSV